MTKAIRTGNALHDCDASPTNTRAVFTFPLTAETIIPSRELSILKCVKLYTYYNAFINESLQIGRELTHPPYCLPRGMLA